MATSPVNLGSSSIDVPTIVKNLVANKRAAPDQAIADKLSQNSTQISSLGNFTSSVSALQTAIASLSDGTAFQTRKVAIGDNTVFTAITGTNAQPGNYDIKVTQLAAAQKTTSPAFTNSSTAVGTGTLTIAIGDKSMSLNVDSTNNSLQTIRDMINKSSDNPGVSASIVTGTDGAHLVLSSNSAGAANAFKVTSSGGDGNLASLNFDPASGTPTVAAQDAKFTIDGLAASSSTNVATTAIDGVTITLAKTGETTLSVTNDMSAVTSGVQGLVNAYNSFIGTYQQLTKYDPTNQQVGALIGDATVSSIKSQISTLLGKQFTGNATGPSSLSDLGVAFQTDGTLKLDTTKLTNALTNNPLETQNLLSGSNGIAPALNTLITGWTSSTGILTQRQNNLNQATKDLNAQQDALNDQMNAYSDRLTKQYTALDAMMTKLAGTTSFLSQQFDMLANSKS
ncbi:flagellar filament capping protein FliD [Luteibacter sp. PPL201]|uniref:Flagellar hook-associated protein 2 n=1 Tax=Luteibacter sahnii TaxID=3021977 RepID=A0ABT6BAK0_9GAMM|nr:flagellar filament capping protein FliD [Luteibacter sp. PPL193]MDY1547120.1 flagellar filament capping protein FliD [Luteibacter sp. PPL193]